MNKLRNFLVIAFIAVFGLFLTQTAEAQKRKIVGGKDLVITWGKLIQNGAIKNNKVPYKVKFKVRNYGAQNVQKKTRVAIQMVQYPLNNNNGSVIKEYLINAPKGDIHFETNPLASNEEQTYTAYVPGGLPFGYRYQLEIKVDGCLNEPDAAPCRVDEAIDDNNNYRLEDLTLSAFASKPLFIPTDTPKPNLGNPIFQPSPDVLLVNGKDLRITWGEIVANGAVRNNVAPHKVNFKVKNFGRQGVETRTRVALNLVQYPLNNNNGRVIKSLLANKMGDNFETTSLASGQEKRFTAYVPNGLPVGYRYQLEIKVDACLNEPDAAPCRVNESNEINNDFRLPDVTVRQ